MSVHAIVLAAGKGTRMKSELAKVLHRAAGRTLLDWVLEGVGHADADRTVVVVGHQAKAVTAALPAGTESVLQEPQRGTGHAVQEAVAHLGSLPPDDTVVIGYADMPLVSGSVYRELVARPAPQALTIATVDPGPVGFGRIVRDDDGRVIGIVEERDCTPEQAALPERNGGLYAFRAGDLIDALERLGSDNSQGEVYLTDVVEILAGDGHQIGTMAVAADQLIGVNSHDELAAVERRLRQRINQDLMRSGVWMLDPERTYVDAGVSVEPGARLYPGSHLEGTTTVGAEAQIGPDTFLLDSTVAAGATVWYSVLRRCRIGEGAEVGPYASLRPGTTLERGAKAGTFVEMKKTTVAEDAKVPHLSYLGDATVGRRANVGAGTITCNYDGYDKHETVIGDDAFIGSDTMLVAPVEIGAGAVTGAGSVITSDVEAGALAIERSPQKEVRGYAERRAARQRARDAEEAP